MLYLQRLIGTGYRIIPICIFFYSALLVFQPQNLYATMDDEIEDVVEDEKDSTGFFEKDRNWAPVPTIISNPTLGTGLALALIYMHPQKEGDTSGRSDITGVAGMYTDTDSWATGLFHSGSYVNNRLRASAALFYADFDLKFYGIGNDSPIRDHPINYNARITFFAPKFLFNFPSKNWFIGPVYRLMKFENSFDFSAVLPGLPEIIIPTQTAGLGLAVEYDSRDNNMWASTGSWFEMEISDYDEYLGGDFDYQKIKGHFVQFIPLVDQFTFAYRLDGTLINGEPPFYDLANLNLRGFPHGLYSDKVSASAQVQINWQFLRRWIAMAFGGGGRVSDDISAITSETTRWAGGVGTRFILNEKQKLTIGVDVTFGEGEYGIYIQMGNGLSQ